MELTSATARRLATAEAFDGVAAEYDRTNTANPILRAMRRRTLDVLRQHVPPGAALIDLGCGPGTDHPAMAAAGYRVTGIDTSLEMVREAQVTAARLDRACRPTILCRSIDHLREFPHASFDAAFSNFGPLNCVPDLADTARQLHGVLRRGGVLVASVMGRLCPWEIALYLSRGDTGRAFLRFRRGPVGVPLKGGTVWTRYVAPGEFTRAFEAAGFARLRLSALGLVAPPPYLEAFAARRPALVSRLLSIDETIGEWLGLRAAGDHFLIVLRRD